MHSALLGDITAPSPYTAHNRSGADPPATLHETIHERRRTSGLTNDESCAASAYEEDLQSLREHGSSWGVFVADSFLLMFGGTQLGYAMGQMGWAWGSGWILYSAATTWVSGHLLGRLCLDTGAATYPELGRAVLGRPGELLVSAMQWGGYYFTGVVQIAYMGANYDLTFEGQPWTAGLCMWSWMLVTVGVVLPLLQVPSFSHFGKLALAASLATVASTAIYLGQILSHGRYTAGDGDVVGGVPVSIPCYDKWTTDSMLANVANIAFTFSGHGTFPEQIREMREPRDFGKVGARAIRARFGRNSGAILRRRLRCPPQAFNVLYALAIPMYLCCAFLAFYAFGNMNSNNVTENLDDSTALHVSLYVSTLFGFPGFVLGQVVLMLKVELGLGVRPTDWWRNAHHVGDHATAAQRCLHPLPPALVRFGLRLVYLGSLLFFAEMLLGAGLATYVNIAGSLGLAAMTYWLPYVLTLALKRGSISWGLALFYAANAAAGLFISATGLYYNTAALAETRGLRLFHEQSCKEGAHFWGDSMWDATLANTSQAYQTLVVGCCANGTTCGQ